MYRNMMGVLIAVIFLFPATIFATNQTGCQEGNCTDGYGKYVFSNGDKYMGEFKSGQPHGSGILYFANGNKYLGAWVNNLRQGQGKFIFEMGHEYTGSFIRNNFDGLGKMVYANGDIYEGNWEANLPNGFGIYYFKKGGRYEGGFVSGSFHGKGLMYYSDGSLFEGTWQNSKKHGAGYFTDSNGQRKSGHWANGVALNNEGSKLVEEETASIDYSSDEKNEKSYIEETETSTVRIWATIVGVASYDHMPTLKYTDDDAYHFYAFLKSPEGGALPDEQVRVLVDDNATKENILNSMERTFLQADENDVVIFYFSGHGVEGAFIPVDFDGFDNRLYHDEIKKMLDSSKAKHKLVLGDACHAGSLYSQEESGSEMMAARSTVSTMLTQYYRAFEDSNGGMAFLMSSKGREVSLEDSGLRSGVFSHFLIRGLKGEADFDHDKLVTVDEVFQFTSDRVKGYTVGAQNPILVGEFDKKMPVSIVRD